MRVPLFSLRGFDMAYPENKTQLSVTFPMNYMHITSNSPRYNLPCHWHTNFEIIRIISGKATVTLNNTVRIYSEGDVLFITPGHLHGLTPDNCVYECILFGLSMLRLETKLNSSILHSIESHTLMVNPYLSENCRRVLPVVRDLSHSLSQKRPGYEFRAEAYVFLLFSIIIEEHLYTECNNDFVTLERLDAIKSVLSYISSNYMNPITLDDLASQAGMNPKYLCRYFKTLTDRTPIDYLNYYRVECSCEMLASHNKSIKEIAIACGFTDQSYYIKTFRKYKGTTPKQYTKLL